MAAEMHFRCALANENVTSGPLTPLAWPALRIVFCRLDDKQSSPATAPSGASLKL
jgi:hypothetical protein